MLDKQPLPGRDDCGALRVRLVAVKNVDLAQEDVPLKIEGKYNPAVVLDLDYWLLMPKAP